MAKLAFLLGLIVLVSASTLEDLKKIDSDEYGKTLIDTI